MRPEWVLASFIIRSLCLPLCAFVCIPAALYFLSVAFLPALLPYALVQPHAQGARPSSLAPAAFPQREKGDRRAPAAARGAAGLLMSERSKIGPRHFTPPSLHLHSTFTPPSLHPSFTSPHTLSSPPSLHPSFTSPHTLSSPPSLHPSFTSPHLTLQSTFTSPLLHSSPPSLHPSFTSPHLTLQSTFTSPLLHSSPPSLHPSFTSPHLTLQSTFTSPLLHSSPPSLHPSFTSPHLTLQSTFTSTLLHFTPPSLHPAFTTPHLHYTPPSPHLTLQSTFTSPHLHLTAPYTPVLLHFTPPSLRFTFTPPHLHFTPPYLHFVPLSLHPTFTPPPSLHPTFTPPHLHSTPPTPLPPPHRARCTGYFTGNGEDGLHLLWSADGYTWSAVRDGESLLHPSSGEGLGGLMRDPSLAVGPDGTFHLVWTTSWTGGAIGYASSRDLVEWSAQRALRVMADEPRTRNCWAPELLYNERRGVWLIFWSSTVDGRFSQTADSSESGLNHRMYATSTSDFLSFSPTRLLFDAGFSSIDGTFLRPSPWALSASNPPEELLWIVKDETLKPEAHKHLRMCRAAWDQLESGGLSVIFGALGPPLSPEGVWAEGPSLVRLDRHWVVYYDAYQENRYRAMRSDDLVHWEDVTAQLSIPFEGTAQRVRHASVLWLPRRTPVQRLLPRHAPVERARREESEHAREPKAASVELEATQPELTRLASPN
ncbi:hypothetical protein AB1Y20_004175 [Prymnesium parvum]|uniref:Arabinosidase BT-3657-like N-terminal domain-containing protein n=1 Tax=Prymnesium parvum TaxID=97485 RepID=A0AB34J743_PRYPA